MITVSPVSDKTQSQFEKLFTQYYGELGCEDDVPHLLSEYVLPDLKAGLISADILFDGENFIGFIISSTISTTSGVTAKAGAIYGKFSFCRKTAVRVWANS